jgi:hypothetical protein
LMCAIGKGAANAHRADGIQPVGIVQDLSLQCLGWAICSEAVGLDGVGNCLNKFGRLPR